MIPIETILEDFGEKLIKDLRAALLKEGVGCAYRVPTGRLDSGVESDESEWSNGCGDGGYDK